MSKREEAARALYWVGYADRVTPEQRLTPDLAWERAGDIQQQFCLAQVDAVIACIREPDEKMTHAGEDQLDQIATDLMPGNYVSGVTNDWDHGMSAKATWQAMLDAME